MIQNPGAQQDACNYRAGKDHRGPLQRADDRDSNRAEEIRDLDLRDLFRSQGEQCQNGKQAETRRHAEFDRRQHGQDTECEDVEHRRRGDEFLVAIPAVVKPEDQDHHRYQIDGKANEGF